MKIIDVNLLFIMVSSCIVLLNICEFGLYQNKLINLNGEKKIQQDKMYKIIELAGGLDKDPYNRKISPNVVKKFCKIATKYSINLDNITDKQFDFIYKKYTDYLIKKYT